MTKTVAFVMMQTNLISVPLRVGVHGLLEVAKYRLLVYLKQDLLSFKHLIHFPIILGDLIVRSVFGIKN